MIRRFYNYIAVLACLTGLSASRPAAPEKLDLYLLIGQSNMAGRGPLPVEGAQTAPGIWVIDAQNEWVPAKDPLHYDWLKGVGVGPGLAFAKEIQKLNSGKEIGLIPCAVGGTSINEWVPGVKPKHTEILPYDAMLARVREAQKRGKIKAILWHQGEQDSNPTEVKLYEEKLEQFFIRLRKDLNAPKTPILIGTLADFYVRDFPEAGTINELMARYVSTHRNTYLVSSQGLKDKGDKVHFSSEAAEELGLRYAQALIHKKK